MNDTGVSVQDAGSDSERTFIPISDDELLAHTQRLDGKVVLITGAANGIGRQTATRFAAAGAKLVIGDLDVAGSEKAVAELRASGREAICAKCDVTKWEDQLALFDLAIQTFGCVDVVVANAGVGELSNFTEVQFDAATGKPKPPNMLAVQVNLVGVLYTMYCAQQYLLIGRDENQQPPPLKSIVVLGSIASWLGNSLIPVYCATKHGVLGLVRSMDPTLSAKGIRISVISPFFAETAIIRNILPPLHRLGVAGIPFTPVHRIAAAIIYATTKPDSHLTGTNRLGSGSAYLLPDHGPVYEVPREEFKLGVYEKMDWEVNLGYSARQLTGLSYASKVIEDIVGVVGYTTLFSISAAALAGAGTISLWAYRSIRRS